MSTPTASTRRAFLKAGSLIAAPIAVPVATAVANTVGRTEAAARLAHHEDEAAIRDLHQAWLRNAGGHAALAADGETLRAIAADHAGEPDAIRIAADGSRASGRYHVAVEIASDLPEGGTFAQMARLQGNSLDHRTERRVLVADYVRKGEGWKIAGMALA
jgi:hypothetical protein